MRYIPQYFKVEEFRCPDCGEVKVAAGLVLLLDILRSVLGQPLHVNSGYRCAKRNKAVGGAERSRHMLGCAADIAQPQGVTFGAFKLQTEKLFSRELYECKAYPARSFIHVAIPRSTVDYWLGGDIHVCDGTNGDFRSLGGDR